MQINLRSRSLWQAIFSLVIFVLKTYFEVEIPKVDILTEMILLVLILAGIIKNHTDEKER
jgi:uncharacterized membrane protein